MQARSLNTTSYARELLKQYGTSTLSYFSLHQDKKFYFSSSGNSFLSYTIIGKIAVVSGDPVGKRSEISMLLREFSYFTKGAGLTSCFIGVSQSFLPFLNKQGHSKLSIGHEAIIQLSTFDKNLLKKKVRRAENHIRSLGIKCQIYTRKDIPVNYLRQLQKISQEWLKSKGKKERGHTMTLGRIPVKQDSDCIFVLAVKGKQILGYMTFVPVYASNSFSLDLSRKRSNCPNGLNEFLLLSACTYFQEKKIGFLSLNFATFCHNKNIRKLSLKNFQHSIYSILRSYYKTHMLYSFNNKFLPTWEERYFTFEKKIRLPHYMYAVAKVEL